MGFERIQTYILEDEQGTSLKAAGWLFEGAAGGGQWKHTDGRPRRTDQPNTIKGRWALTLNQPQPKITATPSVISGLWGIESGEQA